MAKQLFLGILCVCITAFAQAQTLTLARALELGTAHSYMLRADSAKLISAHQKVVQQQNTQIPTLSLNAGYTRLSDNIPEFKIALPNIGTFTLNPIIPNTYSNRASVQEVVFAGFRVRNSIAAAKNLEVATKLDADKDKGDLRINLVSAYYNLFKATTAVRLVQENIKKVDTQLSDLRKQEAQGLALYNDVVRLDLQRTNLDLSLADARSAVDVSTYALNTLLGLPIAQPIAIDTLEMEKLPTIDNLEAYQATAMNERADVRGNEARIAAALSQVKVAESNYYPTVAVAANYYVARPNQRIFPATDAWKDTWDAGVTLSYNITGAYTTAAFVKDAKAQAMAYGLQNEGVKDQARTDIFQNYAAFKVALEKIEVQRKGVKQAQENYRLLKSRYDNQLALLADLLDADVLLLQARLNVETARADANTAYYKLLKAAGKNF